MVQVIHHYVPFTTNVGDLFVRDGIHARLREHFPGAQIVEFKANDPGSRAEGPVGLLGENLERSNREAQLVVVGGSNMYEGPRWRFRTDVDSLNALKVPLAFIGLGVGSVRGDRERPLEEASIEQIRVSHQKALGVAVRDQPTVDFLSGLGLKSTMTACPATFVGGQTLKVNRPRKVVISAPPIRFLPKWGHKGYFGGRTMFGAFRKLLRSYEKQGLDWQVIAQDQKDLEYLESFMGEFGKAPVCFGNETQPYYEAFREADFAVCYRLHMAISCLGWGVPFALIHFDKRTSSFRDTYGAQAVTFDAFSSGDQYRFLKLVTDPQAMEQAAETHFPGIMKRRDEFRSVTDSFYEGVSKGVAK